MSKRTVGRQEGGRFLKHLGIDIGGAHIKVADSDGFGQTTYFPLWQRPEALAATLRQLVRAHGFHDALAVTMTGELADCFRCKAEGVSAILEAVTHAAEGRRVTVYLNDGQWLQPHEACERPWRAAAANWHALGVLASRYVGAGHGLLVDIGSTTTDLVPLSTQGPMSTAATDPQRMMEAELVYTGVIRSPVCAMVARLPWRGTTCPVAQEVFATAADVYVTLGDLDEDPDCTSTADGRPRTREYAHDRLARSICADRTIFNQHDAMLAAREIARHQLAKLAGAGRTVLQRMPASPGTIVLSGCGEFLGRRLANRLNPSAHVVSLADELGPHVSRAATARAVAWIADHTCW